MGRDLVRRTSAVDPQPLSDAFGVSMGSLDCVSGFISPISNQDAVLCFRVPIIITFPAGLVLGNSRDLHK
jgi:hypothetical protein